MKSIKPGRGPSAMGLAGSIFAIIGGALWTIFAYSITKDAPFAAAKIFPLFGFLVIGIGVVNAIYNYKNMTGKERMSIIDIVDEEEGDPLNRRFGYTPPKKYCPYCGTSLENEFLFCPRCGKDVRNSSN